ncbi:hypothetical protein [Pseudomonas iridis]|uniref:hypothetical protein n=1 Tax=Pseudomonas iridis TaxID=2710587 RepID=UPI001E2C94F4|nr:hypothetical protein [Pseudomonas iridis]
MNRVVRLEQPLAGWSGGGLGDKDVAVGRVARLWQGARKSHGFETSVCMIGKALDEDALRLLLSQHAVRECKVARQKHAPQRWTMEVRLGGSQARWIALRSRREPVRTWASLETLSRFAAAVGLQEFVVEL